MRWFKFTILFVICFLTLLVALFETRGGKQILQTQLLKALPFEVVIGKTLNLFPEDIHLQDVTLSWNQTNINIDHLHMKIALLPLLRGQWVIETLDAKGIELAGISEPFSLHVRLEKREQLVQFSDLLLIYGDWTIRGEGLLDGKSQSVRADLQTTRDSLTALAKVDGVWTEDFFSAAVDAKGEFLEMPWTLTTPLSIAEEIKIGPFLLHSPLMEGQGEFVLQDGNWIGHADLRDVALDSLHINDVHMEATSKQMNIEMRGVEWKQFRLEEALLSAAKGETNWRGILSLKGSSLNGELRGFFRSSQIIVEEMEGQYLDLPFQLTTPVFIQWSGQMWNVQPFVLQLREQEALQLTFRRDQNQIYLASNLSREGNSFASMDLTLPLRSRTIDFDGAVDGSLFFQGKIEELFDFFPLGMHHFEGDANAQLALKGTLHAPRLEGGATWTNGSYENYLTGTELINVTARLEGRGDQLYLTELTAQDRRKKGNFSGKGSLHFSPKRHFPFQAKVAFNRLTVVQIDLIEMEAKGELTIEGDIRSALAKGHIEIIEGEIGLPDKIPASYPNLQVSYKHAPKPFELPPVITPYPLHLDLLVDAPEGIFIDGRGLKSEWHGQFIVDGTFANPSAQGKLELTKGEFSFASRQFKLVEGSLSLKGKGYDTPHINISAITVTRGVTITARLVGPINKPQITFQSSPPLPMSSIFSYLLFGQDLSEVSGIQALQLAGAIATVAGEGPDILEITRKSLGIDRLEVVMTSKDGQETLALQIGKLIFPGFLVTIKQKADDSSPNIAIEVDLGKGFTLGAESEQQPPQGKFSLEWNLNY